jgi:two-component system, OmpR family, response regulator
MHILLVEDEHKIADLIRDGLGSRGMQVEHAVNGHIGFERACSGPFDAIVLDIMLPGRDGLSVLEGIRSKGITTPVILLTARNELGDRIKGLDLGADDYLAKPFYVEELYSRINALARRDRQGTLEAGSLRLDRMSRQASWCGHELDLTAREFSLLEYLARSPGEVFTRTQILEHVWGYDFDPATNVVDVCIKRIREKVAEMVGGDKRAAPIETVRGSGYRVKVSP